MSPLVRPPRETPRLKLPVPGDAGPADQIAVSGAIADRLDVTACAVGQGTAAEEPADYTAGLIWWSTDRQTAYYDDGASWTRIGPYKNWRALGSGSGNGASGVPNDWTMGASPLLPLAANQWYRVRANFTLSPSRLSDTADSWVQMGLAWFFAPATPLPGTYRQAYMGHGKMLPFTLDCVVQGIAGDNRIGITYCPGMDQTVVYLQNDTDVVPALYADEVEAPTAAVVQEAGDTLPPAPPGYDVPPWDPPAAPAFGDRPAQRPG